MAQLKATTINGKLNISDTTNSNGSSNSSLMTAGGAWITKSLYVGETIVAEANLQARGYSIRLGKNTNGSYILSTEVDEQDDTSDFDVHATRTNLNGYLGVLGNAVITGSAGNTLEVNGKTKLYNGLEVTGNLDAYNDINCAGNIWLGSGKGLSTDGTITTGNLKATNILSNANDLNLSGTGNISLSAPYGITLTSNQVVYGANTSFRLNNYKVTSAMQAMSLRMSDSEGWNDTSIQKDVGIYGVTTYLGESASYPLSTLNMSAASTHYESSTSYSNLFYGRNDIVSDIRNGISSALVGRTAIRTAKISSIYDSETFDDIQTPAVNYNEHGIALSLDCVSYDRNFGIPSVQMNFVQAADDQIRQIEFNPSGVFFDSNDIGICFTNSSTNSPIINRGLFFNANSGTDCGTYILGGTNIKTSDATSSPSFAIRKITKKISSSSVTSVVTLPYLARGLIMGHVNGYNAGTSGFIASFCASSTSATSTYSAINILTKHGSTNGQPIAQISMVNGYTIGIKAHSAYVDGDWTFIVWYSIA